MKVYVLSWEFDGGNYDIVAINQTEDGFAKSVKKLMKDNMSDFETYAEKDEIKDVKDYLRKGEYREAIITWNSAQWEWDTEDMMVIRYEEMEVGE